MPEPPEPLTAVPKLKEGIAAALDRRQEQVVALFDPSRRHVASRQLMALHLDLYGLEGLIDHITTHRPGGAPDVQALRDELAQAQRELAEAAKKEPTKDNVRRHLDLMARIHGVSFVCPHLNQRIATIEQPESEASVDSELALLRWDEHKLSGWLANPLHWRIPDAKRRTVPPVLMTARIDGPTAGDATNIIRASVAAEKAGLRGTFYIDAGGGAKVKAARYDEHLRNLHRFVRSHTRLKVVLDSNAAVFAPGSCPDAALYVGWYSLRKYVPAFTWRPGAVGWHIASFEAEDLRNAKSTRWCARMIQEGVAATIGAVMEPRLMAFPLPQEFFGLLLTGRYTIAECYWRTTTVVSWRMTLIADPLYNPFKANPQVCPEALPPGLAP